MPGTPVKARLFAVLAATALPGNVLADGQHTLTASAVILPKVVCHDAPEPGALAYAGAALTAPGQVTARLSTTRICSNSTAITRAGGRSERLSARGEGSLAPFRVRTITRQPDGSVVIDVES